ncbi:hypothetical protein C2845_PM05G16270 [Panicum miliaceum]|uniref:DUF1618 domain-containing protein n=1 Tax=Panicum miliaceum TaxID=4540 RepID=A0A3L6T0T5_PANMI|nr:hypothetical protein C2845_PM05G16270 [Panicum miliaceum]
MSISQAPATILHCVVAGGRAGWRAGEGKIVAPRSSAGKRAKFPTRPLLAAAAAARHGLSPVPRLDDARRFVRRREDGSFPAGNPTAASLTNSRGDPFDVCLSLKPPPEPSFLYLRWPDGPAEGEPVEPAAAHGGAVLLLMHYTVPVRARRGLPFPMIDYVVYHPAAPSLRLLPPLAGSIGEVEARAHAEPLHITKQTARRMESMDIGIIHRGPGDFAVAELQIVADADTAARPELRVFNPSVSDQWVLTRPRVVPVHPRDDLDMDHLLWYWDTDAVVPFGTWLCWVDYTAGVMLCNVLDGSSEILFLELPIKQPCIDRDLSGRVWLEAYHALGATKGGDVLKFARVLADDPPSPNGITLPVYHPHPFPNRFTVTTWSLRLASGNKMVWQEQSSVTADQLRDLEEFDHLPRELLMYPTFNLDNPDVVSFVLKEEDGTYDAGEFWLVAVDVMNKAIKSSVLYVKGWRR